MEAVSGIALGATGLTLTSEDSQAMALQIDGLNVADSNREISNTVTAVQLGVDGQYEYSTSAEVTRVVFRLEVRPINGEWSQLDAFALRDNLSSEQSDTYSLSGNLVQHHQIDASEFNPSSKGESKTVSVEVRVKMSVSGSDGKIGEEVVDDSASITVSKTGVSLSSSLSGSGSVGLTTEE